MLDRELAFGVDLLALRERVDRQVEDGLGEVETGALRVRILAHAEADPRNVLETPACDPRGILAVHEVLEVVGDEDGIEFWGYKTGFSGVVSGTGKVVAVAFVPSDDQFSPTTNPYTEFKSYAMNRGFQCAQERAKYAADTLP